MSRFQIGDAVEAVRDIDWKIKAGMRGTIVKPHIAEPRCFGVSWDGLQDGHNLEGDLTDRSGWYVEDIHLALAAPREEPPIIEWWRA